MYCIQINLHIHIHMHHLSSNKRSLLKQTIFPDISKYKIFSERIGCIPHTKISQTSIAAFGAISDT